MSVENCFHDKLKADHFAAGLQVLITEVACVDSFLERALLVPHSMPPACDTGSG